MLQSTDSDYIAGVEELDEQRERSQSLLEHLQDTIATLICERQSRDDSAQKGGVRILYGEMMVPNISPAYSVTRRFRNLSLRCHAYQGGNQEAFVRSQLAYLFLT